MQEARTGVRQWQEQGRDTKKDHKQKVTHQRQLEIKSKRLWLSGIRPRAYDNGLIQAERGLP